MFFRPICAALLFTLVPVGIAFAGDPAAAATVEPSPNRPDYVLQPYDLIKVEVFQELDLEREVSLSQESRVTLPLIGTVDLKGKTLGQAQTLIHDLYDKDYLVNPQINIRVIEYSKETVTVLGAVNKSGSVIIPPAETLKLLDAIGLAEGFSRVADRRHVKLTRMSDDGKTTTTVINADDIIQSTSADQWVLQRGDVIYVPEKIL